MRNVPAGEDRLPEKSMRRAFSITGAAALFLLFSSLLLGCSGAPIKPKDIAPGDYEYTRQYMTWFIKKEMKSRNITGLSIALVDDQRIVWAEGFGYADKANNVPATPETIYGVGSISKLFTATAAMQLAEQGKLDIDKPLQTYLPRFSIKTRFPDAAPITPRTIMTHHAGLPSDLGKGMWSRNPEPFINVVEEIKDEYAAYPPNFIFSYSNLGVTLLGAAIQNVTGRDFAVYMDETLLQPMHMNRSGFCARPDMKPFLAAGYLRGKKIGEGICDRDLPAGALHSNVLDLSRFMRIVFAQGVSGERQILKPETLAEMLRPQNADIPLDFDFRIGLGWMLGSSERLGIAGAGTVAEHSGGIPGFRSQLTTLPEHKLGVVVLSNSSSAGRTVSRIAIKTLKLAFEAKTGILQHEVKKTVPLERRIPEQELRSYEGWYATIVGPFKVTLRGDHMETEIMNKTLRFVPLADGGLGLRYKFLGIIPLSLGDLEYLSLSRATVAGHEIIKAHSLGSAEFLLGEKIEPVPLGKKWLRRVGEYEIVNRGDDLFLPDQIRLRNADGLLLFDYVLPSEDITVTGALLPISETEAIIAGRGRGMGETIRMVPIGNEEEFIYSGFYLRLEKRNNEGGNTNY